MWHMYARERWRSFSSGAAIKIVLIRIHTTFWTL